jgi:hypothetical protein
MAKVTEYAAVLRDAASRLLRMRAECAARA